MKRKILISCMLFACLFVNAEERPVTLYGEPDRDGMEPHSEVPITQVTYDDDVENITIHTESVNENVHVIVRDYMGQPIYNNVVNLLPSQVNIQVQDGTWDDKNTVEIITTDNYLQGFFE